MDSKISQSTILSSLAWKVMEKIGNQLVTLTVSIILARTLVPEDFGLIALISVFLTLSNVFIQSGLGTALIQKKEADNLDFSSVFFISLLIALFLYFFLFFYAPFIAEFFNEPRLNNVIKILSINLFPFTLNSIQIVYLIKKMEFKKIFYTSFIAIIISGVVSIYLAKTGFGVWALVGQQLTNSIALTICLLIVVDWKPQLIFSFSRIKILYKFGWKLLVSNLLIAGYNEVYSVVVGKKYTSEVLGFFSRGKQFPNLIVTSIDGAIQTVLLPAYASNQEDIVRIKTMVRQSVRLSSFIIFPLMIGLAAVAEPFVIIVLTDKWISSVFFVQIFAIFYMFQPIQTSSLQAINAIGRSDIFLKLEIIKKTIGLGILYFMIPYGIHAIAIGAAISSFISLLINFYPNKKILFYSYKEQIKDLLPAGIQAIAMGLLVFIIDLNIDNHTLFLLIKVIIGILIYLALSIFLRNDSYNYIKNIVKNR